MVSRSRVPAHRRARWELDRIETPGVPDLVVHVQEEASREVVYTLRINGESFLPLVRGDGTYTVLAYDPDGFYRKEWKNVRVRKRHES